MDLRLTEEQRMVQSTIRRFVEKELMPLENDVLRNELEGKPSLSIEKVNELQNKAKDAGFWGINTPAEYGGANLGQMMLAIVLMEVSKTFVPFSFGGSADIILYRANDAQKEKYLLPTIAGDKKSCFAITEPGAGSDTQNIKMTAFKDGDEWVLNGEKTFITGGNEADFVMVIAITDRQLHERTGREGVTCFIADRTMVGRPNTSTRWVNGDRPLSSLMMCAYPRRIFLVTFIKGMTLGSSGLVLPAGSSEQEPSVRRSDC